MIKKKFLSLKVLLGLAICVPLTSIVVYASAMSNSTHVYDSNVTLSACTYVGRSYDLDFKENKPKQENGNTTEGSVTDMPTKQTGNLSFKEWQVVATHNSGNYAASVNLGVKNFEHIQGKVATATAIWNNASLGFGNPSLRGYIFQGWYTSATGGTKTNSPVVVSPSTTAYSNTLYAHWNPIGYTIKYNGNNTEYNILGDRCTTIYTGSTGDTACTYDRTSYISNCGFAKEGYTFKCWNLKPDGTGTNYNPGDSVYNWTAENGKVYTLYAIWQPNTYNVDVYNNKPSDSTGNIINIK